MPGQNEIFKDFAADEFLVTTGICGAMLHFVVTCWVVTLVFGLTEWVLIAKRPIRVPHLHESLWFAILAVVPGAPLMLRSSALLFLRSSGLGIHLGAGDAAIMVAALTSLVLGPVALVKSAVVVGPLAASPRANAVRLSFALNWAVTSWVTVMTALMA